MNVLRNASLRIKLQILTLICAAGLVSLAYTAYVALEPNVENTAYHHILEGKDALADVLPPPMFLVEAYAICHQLPDTDDPAQLRQLEAALAKWKTDYYERSRYWQTELPAGPLRDTITRELGEPVDDFFAIVEREFLPAVHSRNEEKCASLLMGSMLQAYGKQHDVVDRVVSLATAYVDDSAKEAAADINGHRAEVLMLLAGLLVGSILFSLWLTASITGPVGRCKTALEAVAAGDLTGQVEVSSRDEIGRMATSLNQAVQNMRNTLHDVRQSADSAAGASKQLSAAAEDISAGAQEQASGLEETAASLEEMTTTVRQNAENAQQAKQVAVGAREVADKGGQVVSRAVTAMTEINDSSRRIAAIITTIDEIAFQTNLLALNAAVEAARAGEQGRGFSVVAAEVRSLAQRSASAAKEIKQLIEDSVNKVDNGTNLVNESGRALQEIVTSVKRVTDIVGEIAAASAEQSQGIDQVNKAVNQMDQVTQANAAQTEELSGTSVALATQAEHLQQLVANFRLDGAGSAGSQRPAAASAPSAPLARVLPFRQKQHTRTAAAAPARAPMAKAVGDDSAGDDFDKAFEEF